MRVAGAVLAGGTSSRMGRTKMLLEVDGRPMASRVAEALSDGGCDPVELIGGSPDELAPLALTVVADRYPGEGPLGGTITALHHNERATHVATHVLVAACDLALLDGATVAALLAAAERTPTAGAIVAHTDRAEPGLVLWNRSVLTDLDIAFAEGMRAVHRALDLVGATPHQVDPAVMRNVNRPGDVPGSANAAGAGQ